MESVSHRTIQHEHTFKQGRIYKTYPKILERS